MPRAIATAANRPSPRSPRSDLPGARRSEAEQGLSELAAAGSDKTGNSENLPRVQVESDVVELLLQVSLRADNTTAPG